MTLFTFGTPNGHKISILLEELGLKYEQKKVDITKGEQSSPEFLKVNPNGKIPAFIDEDGTSIFESIAIMIYLADKHGKFLPKSGQARQDVMSWTIWQAAGLGPMMGQYGHFKVYAKERIPYATERYKNESFRLLGVMEKQLEKNAYLAGKEYSIADMASWPWVRGFKTFYKEAIDETAFPQLSRWYSQIDRRDAVARALKKY